VIHRIDAELACGALVAAIPEDLAVDGVDELLKIFVGWAFSQWPEDFTEALKDSAGHRYEIRTETTGYTPTVLWAVTTGPGKLTVDGGPGSGIDEKKMTPDVTVSGTPAAVLRWAWNREAETAPGQVSSVVITGDADALPELRHCIVEATQ
jgi:hypothetical protein